MNRVRAGGQSLPKIGAICLVKNSHYVEDDLMKRTPHPDAKPMAFPSGVPNRCCVQPLLTERIK
jgi:hypothetical protein